ncbi:XK-related protein 8-like [Cololabis saira]|uniref:XK-related protein 8-like n=1 Tax=Cololabis saira TaxID=129043 RepID=UPI002AD277A1|nr:XK-related protein 8-like [Cololabis saira]
MAMFKYSRLDFLCTCVGLVLLLLDISLDIWAAVGFYQEGAWGPLAVLLLLLVGSSVLVQVFSWFWYSYEEFQMETRVEKWLSPRLKLLHVLQMGIYLRHAGVLETSMGSFFSRSSDPLAVYLSHDLSMLRIIETFSESSPQIVLMLSIILQKGLLDPVTVIKALGSVSAVAFSVTTYHRCLRSFLPEKAKQSFLSSVVYFLWHLTLLLSRLVALALFTSVMPCFIFGHFLCSWLVLFFCAWRSNTAFMDSPAGEWLYRATVALVWYFDWFNVVEGKTRKPTLLYHGYILVDICLLCGLWYWKMSTDPPAFVVPWVYAAATAGTVVALYVLGLLLKVLYYKRFHPNLRGDELRGVSTEVLQLGDEVDAPRMLMQSATVPDVVTDRCMPGPPAHCNRRMKKLAENFYSG